ncbi:MAG: SRPBCC family protein [Solirubrobacteraceae bacterium]|nr:SRPBCC family protein [Solirubrobacteraceae bacterium]
MPVARRTRTLSSDQAAVWALVADPYHLPRWWPHVRRVEAVTSKEFTAVLTATDQGRPVRADYRIVAHEPPRLRTWEQQIEDTPFERVFKASEVTVELAPSGAGCEVRIEMRQRLRGLSQLGAPLVRRGSGRLLERALDALEDLLV